MKRTIALASIPCLGLVTALLLWTGHNAAARQLGTGQPAPAAGETVAPETAPAQPEEFVPLKSCSTNSDCKYSHCSNGRCGACSTSSDCKYSHCGRGRCGACSTTSDCGYGQCSGGRCGACSTSSDCKGWGHCSRGRCGRCTTSSDCKGWGECRNGTCKESPYE